MSIRNWIRRSTRKAEKDREVDMVLSLIQFLEDEDPTVTEALDVLLNFVSGVTLSVSPEKREEFLFLFMKELPESVKHVAHGMGVSFDWEEFKKFEEKYGKDD